MRKFAISLAGVALVVTACSDADPPATVTSVPAAPATAAPTSSTATTSTTIVPTTSFLGPTITYDPDVPRYGGAVVIADDSEPTTLNPYAPGGDNPIVSLVGQAHLAGVFEIDPDTLELIPELVTELPTVENNGVVLNEDGSMDVTWRLRPEATWSDGVAITGADLAFTLDFQQASHDTCNYGFEPQPLPEFDDVGFDDTSLTVRFAQASLAHEQMLRWVVPSHAVADSDYCEGWTTTTWPAAGPFVLENWEREGPERHIGFSRNANYWKRDASGGALPYLDSVEFRFIPEFEKIAAAFTARSVDVIKPPPFLPELPIDRWEESGADVQIVEGPVWEHFNFQFGPNNRNPDSLNGILEFRQAIAHGLDRRALLDDAGYGWLSVSDGFVRHFTRTATNDPWAQYNYDLVRATELLNAACAKAGRDCVADPPHLVYSTTSNADFRPDIAERLVAQLALIGVTVELQLEDSQLFFGDTLNEGSWDMGGWAWSGAPSASELVLIMRLFVPTELPPEGDNFYRWGAPGSAVEADDAVLQVQQLVEEMRRTADVDRVFLLARQIEQILADQVVIIPLNARAVVGAVWADEIQGFVMNPSQAGHTWNIEHWYRIGE